MTSVISIPVHESFDCIIELVENIKSMVDDSYVVLHYSGDSNNQDYERLLKKEDGFLFINRNRLHSHKSGEAGNVTGLTTIFTNNFDYISELVRFDKYAMLTSNELIVRNGLNKILNQFMCGSSVKNKKVDREIGPYLRAIEDIVKINTLEIEVVEGTFYPYEVFKDFCRVSKIMHKKSKVLIKGNLIDAQEAVIPTVIFNMYPELYNNNFGDTFSMCEHGQYSIKLSTISDVANGKLDKKYSVKRIPRIYNDPTRVFCRNLLKG